MYRNNNSRGITPRDRLDPRLLERLALRSELPSDLTEECMCGQTVRNRSRSGYSNNTQTTENSTNGCGCGNNARSTENSRNNCGCGNNTRAAEYENNYDGCSQSARSRTGCGCGNNTRAAKYENNYNGCNQSVRSRTGCGCENNTRTGEYETNNEEYTYDNYNAEYDHSLAIVYSPIQQWQNLYCEEEGHTAGTIFRELDKPFYGSKCHGGKDYE